jgi:hypothetical protein
VLKTIKTELKAHAPFTAFGALTGVAVLLLMLWMGASRSWSMSLYWGCHPLHVFLSALVTAGMYRVHTRGGLRNTILVGYVGSVGIATLSDSVIPYLGESLLQYPYREIHLGFVEKWWLVNPLALAGIVLAYFWPKTAIPHAGHVLLSTWASLFHMTMALGGSIQILDILLISLFLFLAVWVPCCTSDIVFPLVFASGRKRRDSSSTQFTPKKLRVGES